jgi:hypothetical protein
VLVTFKSQASVPPYRIENMCADVAVAVAQAPLEYLGRAQWCAARGPAPPAAGRAPEAITVSQGSPVVCGCRQAERAWRFASASWRM